MQRKYRGQRVDTREWVYGGSVIEFNDNGIITYFMPRNTEYCAADHENETDNIISIQGKFYKVENICTYTGIMDNSEDIADAEDKEVCENDIVQLDYKIRDWELITAVVKYEQGGYILSSNQLPDGYITINEIAEQDADYCWIDGIVSGNLFDNPELMQEVE